MTFVCEGEEVSIKTISDVSGKPIEEIKAMAMKGGNNSVITVDGWDYTVLFKQPQRKRKLKEKFTVTQKVVYDTPKRIPKNKVIVENPIKQTFESKRRFLFLNGEQMNREDISEELNIRSSHLSFLIKGLQSVEINGQTVTTKPMTRNEVRVKNKDNRRTVFITNVVKTVNKYKEQGKSFYVDGKKITPEELSELTRVTTQTIKRVTGWVDSCTINGVDITIKRMDFKYLKHYDIHKDGVHYEHKSLREVRELTGMESSAVYRLAKSENYSKTGWRIKDAED